MLMPKAASHLNNFSQFWENDVGLAGEVRTVEPESIAHPVDKAANG
jgi:hypothetical protein